MEFAVYLLSIVNSDPNLRNANPGWSKMHPISTRTLLKVNTKNPRNYGFFFIFLINSAVKSISYQFACFFLCFFGWLVFFFCADSNLKEADKVTDQLQSTSISEGKVFFFCKLKHECLDFNDFFLIMCLWYPIILFWWVQCWRDCVVFCRYVMSHASNLKDKLAREVV